MPELQIETVGGRRVAYRRAGAGPVIVLLHGAYEDSRIWRRQLTALATDFTVVALDIPGNGGSDDPLPNWGPSDFADCIADTFGALGLESVTVVGLSFGSVLALSLVANRPEVVHRLVLASAYAGWAGSLTPEEVHARITQVLAELDRPASEFVADWEPTLFTEAATQDMRDEVAAIMDDFHPEGMRVIVNAFGPVDLRPDLPSIAVPTLLLYGDRDVRAPVDPVGRDLAAAIPGARLVVIPGAPHLLMVEAAEPFAAEIRAFLR